MPLTEVQSQVLALIAANRSPDSYVAGATVLHAQSDSGRDSDDLDLFTDNEKSTALERSALTDEQTLTEAGFEVRWEIRTPGHFVAIASRGIHALKLEWVYDSAFRFFPLEQDPVLGYRLHPLDAATNKVLALAGRKEIRDLMDCIFLHRRGPSLGTLIWAACGKDQGWTPDFILNSARGRQLRDEEIKRLNLSIPPSAPELKREWLSILDEAAILCDALPAEELGCLYLNQGGEAITPDPAAASFSGLYRHFGSVRGAWPAFFPSNS